MKPKTNTHVTNIKKILINKKKATTASYELQDRKENNQENNQINN